jgi:purine-binding chemotaxis protein CheW
MNAYSEIYSIPRTASDVMRNELQLACFRIGTELYALDIMRIKEIIRPLKLTLVPKAPPFVEGVINLRGAVIPVVDLRKRFDQRSELTRKTRVIVCAVEKKILGLVVDEVTEVRRYSRQEVLPTPRFLKGRGADFFSGVCRREEDLILLLNLKMILSTEERIDLEAIQLSKGSLDEV